VGLPNAILLRLMLIVVHLIFTGAFLVEFSS
jgi:hypothetical protein